MAADLKPTCTQKQALAYIRRYEKAVDREMSKHGGLGSRIRFPTYDLHERALDQATIVKDSLARVELVAGVIDCICGGGMMAPCGFESERIYSILRTSLLDLTAEVQQGLRDKVKTKEFIENDVLAHIHSSWNYVTGDGMQNFAGESLGNWTALCDEIRNAIEKQLTSQEMKVAECERAKSEVEAAKLQLTQRVKEVASAKRTLAAREREERSAMKKVQEAEQKLQALEPTPETPEAGPMKKRAKVPTKGQGTMKRPARAAKS